MKNSLRVFQAMVIIIVIFFIGLEKSFSTIYMSISGRVLFSGGLNGIPNIKIILLSDEQLIATEKERSSVTDDKGNFIFKGIKSGKYRYYIDPRSLPKGYFIDFDPTSENEIIIKEGKNISNLKIYLKKGATVAGRIFGEDGITPLKDIELNYTYYPYANYPMSAMSTTEKTSADGSYRIDGISSYCPFLLINFECPGYNDQFLIVEGITPDIMLNNVDYKVKPETKVIIKGKVIDDISNKPALNAKIIFISKEEQCISLGMDLVDSKGYFEIKGLQKCKHIALIKVDNSITFKSDVIEIVNDLNDIGTLHLNKLQKKTKNKDLETSNFIERKRNNTKTKTSPQCCSYLIDWRALEDCLASKSKINYIFDNESCCEDGLIHEHNITFDELVLNVSMYCDIIYKDHFFNPRIPDKKTSMCMVENCCRSNNTGVASGSTEPFSRDVIIKCCTQKEYIKTCCDPEDKPVSDCAWIFQSIGLAEIYLCPRTLSNMGDNPGKKCYCPSCQIIHEMFHSCDSKYMRDYYCDRIDSYIYIVECSEARAYNHVCNSFCFDECGPPNLLNEDPCTNARIFDQKCNNWIKFYELICN